ncbi:MAG: hypothetical protein PHG00_01370 [Methylococcales bacterium]|nr:hypothetical protein [Methylococcales bacterium]
MAASEQRRADVAVARERRQAWQKSCDLSKLVFLDETGASTDRIRGYGRALGGARCKDAAPAGYWQTLTFIAGLRADRLTAPGVPESGHEWRSLQRISALDRIMDQFHADECLNYFKNSGYAFN